MWFLSLETGGRRQKLYSEVHVMRLLEKLSVGIQTTLQSLVLESPFCFLKSKFFSHSLSLSCNVSCVMNERSPWADHPMYLDATRNVLRGPAMRVGRKRQFCTREQLELSAIKKSKTQRLMS